MAEAKPRSVVATRTVYMAVLSFFLRPQEIGNAVYDEQECNGKRTEALNLILEPLMNMNCCPNAKLDLSRKAIQQ